jgi:hypothetical protein
MRKSTNWRAWVAVAVFLVLLIGALLVFRLAPGPEQEAPEIGVKPSPAPAIPPPARPLDRAELIDAADRAADAAASGRAFPEDLADLVGRRFVLRIPFGCGAAGVQNESTNSSWSYDASEQTLRASVTLQTWSDDARVRELAGPLAYEAAEGFWISQPWIRSGDCPLQPGTRAAQSDQIQGDRDVGPGPPSEPTIAPARETLGIAEFFLPGSPRAARRRGRPYTLSVKIDPENVDLSRGLRVLIEGRLLAFPGGSPFACSIESSDLRPLCLIRADMTKVAISGASDERTLAEWSD